MHLVLAARLEAQSDLFLHPGISFDGQCLRKHCLSLRARNPPQRPRRMTSDQGLIVAQCPGERRDCGTVAPVSQRHGSVSQQAAPLGTLNGTSSEATVESTGVEGEEIE